jgi:hypothetical protein
MNIETTSHTVMVGALANVKPGDKVVRMLAGIIPMHLVVSEVTDDRIKCGSFEFDRSTGAEIDEGLELPQGVTVSFIKVEHGH